MRRCGQVVDVTSNSIGRRERHDGHPRRVNVDGEVGEQFLDELQLVVEVGSADAGALVDEEHQFHFAVRRPTQRLHMSLKYRPEHVDLLPQNTPVNTLNSDLISLSS